jgi:(p)ppGpp synthase/HD superfamily hydrolase
MGPCVGVLSVNGVSIHRSHCEKYKESRGYSHEKTVDIKWDNEMRWQKSLFFHLNIRRLTVERTVQVLASIQPLPRIHDMTTMKRGFGTALQVMFHNFQQAQQLFFAFENADVTVEIEEYGKIL